MRVYLVEDNKSQNIDIYNDKLRVRGAYILFFKVEKDTNIHVGRFGDIFFQKGNYLYVGSAYGSGGLRSRLKRHSQIQAKKHWHFDYIRPFIILTKLEAYTNGHECKLVEKCIKEYKAKIFYKGLGSSDCKTCESHFLML